MVSRRDMLIGGAVLGAAGALPRFAGAQVQGGFAPKPGSWRHFEIVTRIEMEKPQGPAQAWVPVPSVNEAAWFKSGESTWTTNAGAAALRRDPAYGAAFVHAEWKAGDAAPAIEVTSRVSTQDRAIDLARPGAASPLSEAERALYTKATALIATDGIVKETSDRIVGDARGDLDKARRIYHWVVENSSRDPGTRGCGIGDVAAMLRSGKLSGKCADLNALYVGLARAAGLAARDVYGIRVAPSKFGYRSLGAGSATITKAQHCRAEVHVAGIGWVPVDPADVRKVVLEEPPANLPLTHPTVISAREGLFGSWEGNWLAYNFAHDVALPGAKGPVLEFLMYPQAEVAGLRLDCLDPDTFRYSITAREISV